MEDHQQLLADTLQILQNFINETPEFSKYLSDTITEFYKIKVNKAIETLEQMRKAYIYELGLAKEVTGKVAGLRDEIQRLNKRNKTLTEENRVLSQDKKVLASQVEKLQSFQKQADSSQNSLAAEKVKLSSLKETLARLKDELAIAQSTILNIQEKNDTSIIEKTAYKSELRELNLENKAYKNENEKLKQNLQVANRANNDLIASLKIFDSMQAKYNALKATYLTNIKSLQQLTRKHTTLGKEYNRLLKTATELQRRIELPAAPETLGGSNLEKLRL